MSYKIKYRRQAIAYWEDGHSARESAKVFSVSTRTLQNWKIQFKETGSLKPKTRRDAWRKIAPDRLNEYLREHPDAYLKEIAGEFHCSIAAASKALKRWNLCRTPANPLDK